LEKTEKKVFFSRPVGEFLVVDFFLGIHTPKLCECVKKIA
jgi:hypothetical protein